MLSDTKDIILETVSSLYFIDYCNKILESKNKTLEQYILLAADRMLLLLLIIMVLKTPKKLTDKQLQPLVRKSVNPEKNRAAIEGFPARL